jgi:hypothetical protein
MKTFLQHETEGAENSALLDELDEGFLRTASAAVLFQRIHAKSKEVHNSKNAITKLNAIASQNTHLAAMIVAMTQFLPTKKGK